MKQQSTAPEAVPVKPEARHSPRGPPAHVTFAACCVVSVWFAVLAMCCHNCSVQQLQNNLRKLCSAAGVLCVDYLPAQPQQYGVRAQHNRVLFGSTRRLASVHKQDNSQRGHHQEWRRHHASSCDSNHNHHYGCHTGSGRQQHYTEDPRAASSQTQHSVQYVGPPVSAQCCARSTAGSSNRQG